MFGNGKDLTPRLASDLYYDHPLLAVAFNSDIADASQQQQAVLTPGSPLSRSDYRRADLLNAALVFHGTVCGAQGSNAALCRHLAIP